MVTSILQLVMICYAVALKYFVLHEPKNDTSSPITDPSQHPHSDAQNHCTSDTMTSLHIHKLNRGAVSGIGLVQEV